MDSADRYRDVFAEERSVERSPTATDAYGSTAFKDIYAHGYARQHNGHVYNTFHNHYPQPALDNGGDREDEKTIHLPNNLVQSYVERSLDGVPITQQIVSYLNSCKSRSRHPPVAVVLGMGGAGKTQIALRCCEILSQDEAVRSLLWIDASSNYSIAKSFADIAESLIPKSRSVRSELGDKQNLVHNIGNTVQVVLKYIQRHPRWALVFDNFDHTDRIKPAGKLHSIRDYWPQNARGAVLILSRNREHERLGREFDIGRMSENECVQVLRHYICQRTLEEASMNSDVEDADEDLNKVANTLGCLALAIDQAGAYMKTKRISAQKFLHDYASWKVHVLQTVPGDSVWEYRRPSERMEHESLSVFTTWEMSLNCLSGSENVRLQKREFISLCSFFEPSKLHEELFTHRYQSFREPSDWRGFFVKEGKWFFYEFEDLITELRGLSLLESFERGKDGIRFSIHPLVCEWIKRRLSSTAARTFTINACLMLAGSIPKSLEYDTYLRVNSTSKMFAAHALRCSDNCAEFVTDCCLAAVGPLQDIGLQFIGLIHRCGTYGDALSISERALQWRSRHSESWCSHYFQVAMRHADLLRIDDQVEAATKLLQELQQWAEQDPSTPDEMRVGVAYELGRMFYRSRRFEDALHVFEDCYKRSNQTLHKESIFVELLLAELAKTCIHLGCLDQAEACLVEAHSRFSAIDHPEFIQVLQIEYELQDAYVAKGKCEEALGVCRRNLQRYTDQFGMSDVATSNWVLRQASAYHKLGQTREAFKAVEELLKAAPNTPTMFIAKAHSLLGGLHMATRDLDKSASSFQDAISSFREKDALLSYDALECCHHYTRCLDRKSMAREAATMWRDILKEYDRGGELDDSQEAKIFFGLFFSLREDATLGGDAGKAQLREYLDRSVNAARQAEMDERLRVDLLKSAAEVYASLDEPRLADRCSEDLLLRCFKHEECQLSPKSTDIETLEVACSVPLPGIDVSDQDVSTLEPNSNSNI